MFDFSFRRTRIDVDQMRHDVTALDAEFFARALDSSTTVGQRLRQAFTTDAEVLTGADLFTALHDYDPKMRPDMPYKSAQVLADLYADDGFQKLRKQTVNRRAMSSAATVRLRELLTDADDLHDEDEDDEQEEDKPQVEEERTDGDDEGDDEDEGDEDGDEEGEGEGDDGEGAEEGQGEGCEDEDDAGDDGDGGEGDSGRDGKGDGGEGDGDGGGDGADRGGESQGNGGEAGEETGAGRDEGDEAESENQGEGGGASGRGNVAPKPLGEELSDKLGDLADQVEAASDTDVSEQEEGGYSPDGEGNLRSAEVERLLSPAFAELFEKGRMVLEIAGRMERSLQQIRDSGTQTAAATEGITQGNDWSVALAQELALLDDPETEDLVLERYVESRMLQFDRQDEVQESGGPLVILLDTSGSMDVLAGVSDAQYQESRGRGRLEKRKSLREEGLPPLPSRFDYGVALCITLARDTVKDGRTVTVVPFGSEASAPIEIKNDDAILQLLTAFEGGGTDFESPLTVAADLIEQSDDYTTADILLITDGGSWLDKEWHDAFLERKRELRFRIFGLNIATEWWGGIFMAKTLKVWKEGMTEEEGWVAARTENARVEFTKGIMTLLDAESFLADGKMTELEWLEAFA